jgi:hypothetical protein
VGARLPVIVTLAGLTIATPPTLPAYGAQRPAPACNEWQECRRLALEAREAEQYERFHDLAWRAVQTGAPNDPGLMYLLTRAQSLSGRPRDAVVMLRRLADRGIVTDAIKEADFDRARLLPEWPDLEQLMERVALASTSAVEVATASPPAPSSPSPASASMPRPPSSASPAAPATTSKPAATVAGATPAPAATAAAASAAVNTLRFDPRPAEEVSRFSAAPFVASGLAYDAVSGRFLFGDAGGRRLIALGEGSTNAVDLVRAASAQFHDVTAFEIDVKRGDLWVASTAPDGAAAAIHRLQLISGRPMSLIESLSTFPATKLIDLAVEANGALLVLDAGAPRIIRLEIGGKVLEDLASLDVPAPASIALAGDARVAYVAHRDGILRLDLQQRSTSSVTAPAGITLGGFERIRWHRSALVGVQTLPDGTRHLVRLQLNRGRAVTDATIIGTPLVPEAGPTFATVLNDYAYYLTTQQSDSSTTPGAKVMNVVVRRIRLP